jgi:hypothetical protein
MVLSAGFLKLWSRTRLAAALVAFCYLGSAGIGIYHYYQDPAVEDLEDWRGVAKKIKSEAQEGDVAIVVALGRKTGSRLEYYLNRKIPVYPCDLFWLKTGKHWTPKTALKHQMDRLPSDTTRVWLVNQARRAGGIATLISILQPHFPYPELFKFHGLNLIVASRENIPQEPRSRE